MSYETELEKYGVIAFVPSGNSMWPTLKNRAQSVIVGRREARLKRFDVAFYRRQDVYVLHRVMEVVDGGYIICGDSQLTLEKVKEEQVFGKMLGFYKKDKYVEATDVRYIKKVERWFGRENYRKFRLKIFYFSLALRHKLKKIFLRKGQN